MSLYPPHPKTNQDRVKLASLNRKLDDDGGNFLTGGRLSRSDGSDRILLEEERVSHWRTIFSLLALDSQKDPSPERAKSRSP